MTGITIIQNVRNHILGKFRIFLDLPVGERWRQSMFWSLWVYLIFFSFGPSVREFFPSLCALCLIFYYRYTWKDSTLRRFGGKIFLVAFFAAALWGVIFSQDIWYSFLHVGRGANKAFVLPFVAMECVRCERELRRLAWALAFAVFWQGGNGIYQSITGFDFVDHTPILWGRLTGSLSDYRVGNYMALSLVPAAAIWFALRQRLRRVPALCLTLLLLGPGLYMLYFTYTRSGYLALCGGLALWCTIMAGRIRWWPVILAASLLLLAIFCMPERSFDAITGDGRWDLWRFAWAVFEQAPWTGAGFGRYNEAFRALGHVPVKDALTISHPHSIYLQLLCEGGIIGLVLALTFLLGMLWWGYVHIRPHLATELRISQHSANASVYWRMAALFWCAWGAYLVNGIFGHDFFRIWWQAMVMTHLGIMIGAVVNGPERD